MNTSVVDDEDRRRTRSRDRVGELRVGNTPNAVTTVAVATTNTTTATSTASVDEDAQQHQHDDRAERADDGGTRQPGPRLADAERRTRAEPEQHRDDRDGSDVVALAEQPHRRARDHAADDRKGPVRREVARREEADGERDHDHDEVDGVVQVGIG